MGDYRLDYMIENKAIRDPKCVEAIKIFISVKC